MTPQLTFPVVCISESELLQWVARGRIHLLLDRVIQDPLAEGVLDVSLFASCPVLKLDDAKGRVWVSLSKDSVSGSRAHPYAHYKNVLDLPITDIQAVGSILPQYKRRLENLTLPISEATLEAQWDAWIGIQGAYERYCVIQDIYRKIGFELPKNLDADAIRMAMRPKDQSWETPPGLTGWKNLIAHRDEILQKLRFDGHAGEKTFFAASVASLIKVGGAEIELPPALHMVKGEGPWEIKDISHEILNDLQRVDGQTNLELPIFIGAAYLQSFDELHYGNKNWQSIFSIARFCKYTVSDVNATELLFFTLGSLSADALLAANLPRQF